MKIQNKLLTVCALMASMVNAFEVKTRLWSESEDLAKAFVEEMTLDEKINMVTGSGNSFGPCIGYLEPIERLGFKGMCFQDGPAGVRSSNHTTTFPSGLNIASTFDQDLMRKLGVAIGEECRAKGVNVILGPAMNMYRSPVAGRNWEGYGEDTFLASVAAKNVVGGIASQGVFATAKHFVGNEQETKRSNSNSIIDERVLQEVYFPPFKAAVVAGAGGFMSAYNQLNGIPSANNTYLLNKVLKKQMLFHGFVMSDWWGTKDKTEIMNGLDINMPGGKEWGPTVTESYWGEELKEAIENEEIDISYLDDACVRVMTMMYRYRQMDDFPDLDLNADGTEGHTELVREAAAASVVLLKNDEDILPLSGDKYKKIAIIGDGALPTKKCTDNGCQQGKMSGVVALGWGSGTTNMDDISDPLSALTERAEKDGIEITSFTDDDSDTETAAKVAAEADLAIVVVVADSGEEYMIVEGNQGDRKDLDLWHNGNDLVAAVAAANKNTVVVIYSPGVVNLPFLDDIKGLVYAGMPGKEAGHGLADVLFNDVAPSGKLPFTWGKKREDYCCDVVTGKDQILQVPYEEGMYIGYKWFDKNKIEPYFSFGHGLTYAKFKFHDDAKSFWYIQTQRLVNLINGISTTVTIENTSDFGGYVTPEVFVTMPSLEDDPRLQIEYPELLFKNFTKIYLEGGEKRNIQLLVAYQDTKYFNMTMNDWDITKDGKYQIHIGFSHDDIAIKTEVENYNKTPPPPKPYCFALSEGYDCCFENEVVYIDEKNGAKWGVDENGEWCGVEQPRYRPPPETTTTFTYPEPTIFGNPHNVYEDADEFYVFPNYQKQVKSSYDKLIAEGETEVAEIVAKVARYPTPTWLFSTDSVKLVPQVLRQVRKQMEKTGKKILTSFIIYNLPNRDCSAEASKGELGIEHLGVYKKWIDEIRGYFKEHNGPIVAIIEPDSLGNMVASIDNERCKEAFDTQMEAITYAITQLNLPNVGVYQDLAQVGWLGWSSNFRFLIPILEDLLNRVGTGVLRGFSSNVSNTQPLVKPDPPDVTLQGNPSQSEYDYSLKVREELKKVGMVDFGWVVDTSRNGQTNIKTKGENWCNIKGAGIGRRPEANPEDLPELDAVYWFKPPGESDGSDRKGQMGYDPICASEDALTDSPPAGQWFHKQFVELAVNANPSLADEPKFEFPDFDALDKEMSECWSEEYGYPCCAPSNNKIKATDGLGDWGVENGDWCGINFDPMAKKPTGGCWAKELGYQCCTNPKLKVVESDENGDWSIENGEWCGIYKMDKCWSEKLGYPCCNDCVEVALTNKDGKWGLIGEQWCGIPEDC